MAALTLQTSDNPTQFIQSFTGDNRYIFDYLAEEVLQQQSPTRHDFLLQTSILDRLIGSLCDAVLAVNNAGIERSRNGRQTLAELDRANLFILPLDDKRDWYRYNHLFADLLKSQLRATNPELIPTLHRRASGWYAKNGYVDEAIAHALRGQDFAQAAQLVEDNGTVLLQRGELVTLLGWLQVLPHELANSHPMLQIYFAWTLLLSGRRDKVEPHLQQAAILLSTLMPDNNTNNVRGQIAAIRAFCAGYDADIPQAIELANQALALLTEDEFDVRSVVAYMLGGVSYLQGDIDGAMAAFAEAEQIGRQAGNIFAVYNKRQLLDLGCGAGRDGFYLAANGRFVTGVDAAESGLSIATRLKTSQENAPLFAAADARQLPFSDNAFEGVYCFGLLHEFTDDNRNSNVRRVMAEIERVLMVKGILVLSVLAGKPKQGLPHVHYFTKQMFDAATSAFHMLEKQQYDDLGCTGRTDYHVWYGVFQQL